MRDQPWKMAVGWIGQGLPGGLSWCARARGPSGLRVRTLWFIHYDLAEKLLSATKKSKNTFAALSLAAGQHRCFGKLLLCFVFFPLLSKTETFRAWKNQQPPFLLPGAEEAVCDAANARYRKHNRSWCRPRRRPLALRICFCHESRMLAAVYGLGRYISPGPRIIFSGWVDFTSSVRSQILNKHSLLCVCECKYLCWWKSDPSISVWVWNRSRDHDVSVTRVWNQLNDRLLPGQRLHQATPAGWD